MERDNTDNQLLCINPTNGVGAKPAGLQVKASHNGVRYVVSSIKDYHYPVLYFDLQGDWGEVQKSVFEQHPTATLVHPDEIQHEIKHILKGYFDIVVALLRGETTIERIIQESRWKGDSILPTGINAAETTSESKLILPSHLRGGN